MKIVLGIDHPGCVKAAQCGDLAGPLHTQLATGDYDWPASILCLDDFSAYLARHRTARKRAAHAWRLGYRVERISRADHPDAIYAINTSLPERQGRPMAESYLSRPSVSHLPTYACPRHRIDEWGAFGSDGTLVAYLVLYVCGDLAMISQILGHGDHLANDIMYALVVEALRATVAAAGPATVFYNLHSSGTEGLRFFKERLGLSAQRVEWAL